MELNSSKITKCHGCNQIIESGNNYFCSSCSSLLQADQGNKEELNQSQLKGEFMKLLRIPDYNLESSELNNAERTEIDLECCLVTLADVYSEATVLARIRRKISKQNSNPMKLVKGFSINKLVEAEEHHSSGVSEPLESRHDSPNIISNIPESKKFAEDCLDKPKPQIEPINPKPFRIKSADVKKIPYFLSKHDSLNDSGLILPASYISNSGQLVVHANRPLTNTSTKRNLNLSKSHALLNTSTMSFLKGNCMRGASRSIPAKTLTLASSSNYFSKASIPSLVPKISLRKMNDYNKSLHFERYFPLHSTESAYRLKATSKQLNLQRPFSTKSPAQRIILQSGPSDRGTSRLGSRPLIKSAVGIKGKDFKSQTASNGFDLKGFGFISQPKTSRIAFVQECAHIMQGRTLASSIRY